MCVCVCVTDIPHPLWTRAVEQCFNKTFSNGISDVRSSIIEGLEMKIVRCECLCLNHMGGGGGARLIQPWIFDLWKILLMCCFFSSNRSKISGGVLIVCKTTCSFWGINHNPSIRNGYFPLGFYDNKHHSRNGLPSTYLSS